MIDSKEKSTCEHYESDDMTDVASLKEFQTNFLQEVCQVPPFALSAFDHKREKILPNVCYLSLSLIFVSAWH